jgi:hypothetical protein
MIRLEDATDSDYIRATTGHLRILRTYVGWLLGIMVGVLCINLLVLIAIWGQR